VLGECKGNVAYAVRKYREKYPYQRVPNRRNFIYVHRRPQETEIRVFRGIRLDIGPPLSVRNARM
jgi:hypothetical protein